MVDSPAEDQFRKSSQVLTPPQRAGGGALRCALAVFAVALAMHLPWLGLAPIAGTEGHRIFPAHAMAQSGWWSVPMLFGRAYLAKPPLHYWLIALSETVFRSGNVVVWRLPSAIAGAALCGFCCWFGGRWFGRVAGWISGFCAVGLITLWGQNHVADIDATNTLATALAAFCGVELLIVRPKNAIGWIIATGLSLAATLLTKGPGGLPIIVGVWIWSAFAASQERRPPGAGDAGAMEGGGPPPPGVPGFTGGWTTLKAPRFWLAWVIGISMFGAWMLVAAHALHARGLPIDWMGVQEGTDTLRAHSMGLLGRSLLTLAPTLFAYGLPVSLAIPIYFHRDVRKAMDESERRIAGALAYSILFSWLICILSSMVNPRYGYPTLIPLCPLAGAVAAAASKGERSRIWLGIAASGSAIMFFGGSVVLTKLGWPTPWGKPLLIATLVLELILLVWTIWQLQSSWRGAWGIALLAILTIFPFSIHEQIARIATSGVNVAPMLHRIVGTSGPLAVGGAVTSKPEAFYYAGTRLRFYKTDFTPSSVPPGTWVVLDPVEYKAWRATAGVKLTEDQFLCKWGSTKYRIAWYGSR